MKKTVLLLFSLCLFALAAMAQDDDKPAPRSNPVTEQPSFKPFKKKKGFDINKLRVEPVVGFGAGNNSFNLNLRPVVKYNVWKGLYLGAGITFIYYRQNNLQGYVAGIGMPIEVDYTDQVIGGSVTAQYNVWRGFFLRTQFEFLNRRIPKSFNGSYSVVPKSGGGYQFEYERRNVPVLLVGGGYEFTIGKIISMPLGVYYNTLHNTSNKAYNIYRNSVVIQLGLISFI